MKEEGGSDEINPDDVERIDEFRDGKKEVAYDLCHLLCMFGTQQGNRIAEHTIRILLRDINLERCRFRDVMRAFELYSKI